jgi:hypothetical protein
MFEHMTDADPDGPFSKELVENPPHMSVSLMGLIPSPLEISSP